MFVSAHDDDIVTGGGLTFLAAIEEGIEVHAVVTTDGRMGYCRPEQRRTISQIRYEEAQRSFQALALPRENLHYQKFPDCNLSPYRGRHFTTIGDLQNWRGPVAYKTPTRTCAQNPPDASLPADAHRPAPRPPDRARRNAHQLVPRPREHLARELGKPIADIGRLRIRDLLRFRLAPADSHRGAGNAAHAEARRHSRLCQPGAD